MNRRAVIAAVFLLVLGVAAIPLLLQPRPERASGGTPEAIAPFGIVTQSNLIFRWSVPADGAPVRIEVFDVNQLRLWRSEPTFGGSLQPPDAVAQTWPADDLLWRPVAGPEDSPERPGDLAAFTLAR